MICPYCHKEIELVTTNIPPNLNNPKFIEKWNEWGRYRKDNKWKFAISTQTKQLNMLSKESNPVEILERSMQNGWQGLFPYKNTMNTIQNVVGLAKVIEGKY